MPRRPRGVLLAAALAMSLGASAGMAEPALRGRPLQEVLHRLQERGLTIIFSSAVVDDALRVTAEPVSADPRAMLDEILRPLGLEAQEGPRGALVIVRAPGWKETGTLRGRVVSHGLRTPVPGATVNVSGTEATTTTGVDGAFELTGIPTGTIELAVEAEGFEPRTVGRVRVRSREAPLLTVTLPALPEYLEQVVVVPSRVSLIQQEQNAALTISDDHALLAPTFGGDVSRLVERLPGVAAPENTGAFSIRGSLPGDVSIVLDGLELYDPFHLLDLQSPFSLLDMNLVDRIEFIGGPFTAGVGDRHGGLINVATWTPDEPHSTRIELGSLNTSITHGGPMERSPGSWLASIRAWYPQATGTHIELGEPGIDPRFADAYLRYTFHVSRRAALSAHTLMAYDALEFQEEDGDESVDASSRSGYFWVRSLNLLPRDIVAETVVSVGRLERHRRGMADAEDAPLQVVDDRSMNFSGVKHDLRWMISDAHLLQAGLETHLLEANYRYLSGAQADPAAALNLHPSGLSLGGYASWRAAVTPAIATEVGVRWDRQGHTEERQVSPRLNAVFRLGERSEIQFGVGQFFQSQRIHELQVEDGQTRFLPAELSRSVGLTFQHSFPNDLRLRIDAYGRKLSHLRPRYENLFSTIELYPETEPDRVLVAADHARLRGLELLLHTAPGKAFNWWVGYALSSAEDVVNGDGIPRSRDQTHAVTFLVGYRAGDRWALSLSGSGHSGWPATTMIASSVTLPDGSVQVDAVPGPRNAERLPFYMRFDFKASRSFALPNGRVRLDLDVLNLLDRDNVCCVDDFRFRPRADGSVRVDTTHDVWLGTTPSLKLVWEFR